MSKILGAIVAFMFLMLMLGPAAAVSASQTGGRGEMPMSGGEMHSGVSKDLQLWGFKSILNNIVVASLNVYSEYVGNDYKIDASMEGTLEGNPGWFKGFQADVRYGEGLNAETLIQVGIADFSENGCSLENVDATINASAESGGGAINTSFQANVTVETRGECKSEARDMEKGFTIELYMESMIGVEGNTVSVDGALDVDSEPDAMAKRIVEALESWLYMLSEKPGVEVEVIRGSEDPTSLEFTINIDASQISMDGTVEDGTGWDVTSIVETLGMLANSNLTATLAVDIETSEEEGIVKMEKRLDIKGDVTAVVGLALGIDRFNLSIGIGDEGDIEASLSIEGTTEYPTKVFEKEKFALMTMVGHESIRPESFELNFVAGGGHALYLGGDVFESYTITNDNWEDIMRLVLLENYYTDKDTASGSEAGEAGEGSELTPSNRAVLIAGAVGVAALLAAGYILMSRRG